MNFKKIFFFKKKFFAFTLIEILVVIFLLGILSTFLSNTFITSLKKGRDARRKTDLQQIQRALEMYYEDKKHYPTPTVFPFGLSLSDPESGKVYMQKVPNDPVSGNTYIYQSDGTYYRLYSCIENQLDQGPGVNPTGYLGINCGNCGLCKFQISSPNITP